MVFSGPVHAAKSKLMAVGAAVATSFARIRTWKEKAHRKRPFSVSFEIPFKAFGGVGGI